MSIMIRKFVLFFLIGIFPFVFMSYDNAAAKSAQGVFHQYMQSLISGNVESIQQCLDKDFQKRVKNTFQDPTQYRLYLIERYEGAIYHILEQKDQKNGEKSITMEIQFKNNAKKKVQLYLSPKNKIFKEVVL